MLMHSNRVIIFLLAERAQCMFCMQEENPETKMRGRELPGGGAVVAVDSGCVVVAGSVSSNGEKGLERCYSVYLLPCLSSIFQLSSILSFRSLALFFCSGCGDTGGSSRCWWWWKTGES
jgi:hypothetical protein